MQNREQQLLAERAKLVANLAAIDRVLAILAAKQH